MHDDDERLKDLFATIQTPPGSPSRVDIGMAIDTGKRRRRIRRFGISAAAASLSVVTAIAVPYAVRAYQDRGGEAATPAAPSATAGPAPAKARFQTRAYERPAAHALPTSCQGKKLRVPGGGIKSYVRNLDPSGRYVTGRVYGDERTPVLWRDGQPFPVPMGGDDDILQAANTKGDAVGFSYPIGGPEGYAYVGGVLTRLKGGSAQANGINDRGVISGELVNGRESAPVVWPSATSDPVKLAVPEGITVAGARDIDEDGTVVGNIEEAYRGRTAYVWYPDGTAQALPAPVYNGAPSKDFDARRVRNGWVTGYASFAGVGSVGVRWDLVTGEVLVLDRLEWSNDVSPHGWIVGMDRQRDAVLTDGVTILRLPDVFPQPAEYGMNWGEAISDDGLTIAGLNDDERHDGEQRGVVWNCR